MKKLFSYLLISSMVVLSSCTNYDDQFDDLNSQITSLKSQIEGFSSLSSGLTALQGTVSSLQSAVAALPKTATPATDISGLEASVAALQTSLASASTSAEVAAITTQLTAAQTALANAVAANGTAVAANGTAIAAQGTDISGLEASVAALQTALASASTSAEVAAITTQLTATQTALAAAIAAQVTDISGLEAAVAELKTALASASTSAEVAAITTQLTAAQTALATAIAANGTAASTNATAIASQGTDIAALQASLVAVQATLAEMATALAAASTAADITALTAELALVQADLTNLLNQNNIYTPANASPLSITTAAELTFAEGLGEQIRIINGSLTVTHAPTMDATRLAAVLAKVTTVTGTVNYTATSTAITPTAGFTKLTSAGTLTVNASGDISFPVLASAGVVTLTDNTKTTGVSLPVLASVTSLNGSTAHTINLTGATGFNAGALTHYTNGTLKITTKSGLTNLDSLVSTKKDEPTVDQITDLTINGATELSIDKLEKGEIDADKITAAEFPLWQGDNGSVMSKATTVVLPKAKAWGGSAEWNIKTMFPNATKFHIIAASSALTTTTTGTISVKVVDHADMETLILDGVLATVTITGSTDVDDITLTGTAQTVNIQNTAVTQMNLGYSSGKIGATNAKAYNGTLTIKDNEDMTSFTADKVDDVYSLTIQSNAKLATISMAALDSKGTTATGTVSNVQINGNDLVASNFQLPSAVTVVPAVTGKITSASGLGSLQKYIDEVIKDAKSVSNVTYDKIEKYTTSAGAVHEVGGIGGLAAAPSAVTYAGTTAATFKSVTPGTPGAAFVVVDVSPDNRSYDVVLARKQTNTQYVVTGSTFSGVTPEFTFDGNAATDGPVSLVANSVFTNAITDFVSTDPDTWFPEVVSALQSKIDAAGYAYSLSASNDYGATGVYSVQVLSTSGLADASGGLSYNGVIWVTLNGTQVSSTLASANALANLHTAIAAAINNGALSRTFTATAGSTSVTLEKQIAANNGYPDLDFTAYPTMTFGGYTTNTNTSAVGMSYTLAANQSLIKKWRATAVNNNTAVNAQNLEAGGEFLTVDNSADNTAINLTMTAVPAAAQYATTTASTLQIPFSAVTAGSSTDDGTGSAASIVDNTIFL